MANQFMRAEEVAKELGISKSFAYKLIRQLNQELKAKGFVTISGRINRVYFQERLYDELKERKENDQAALDELKLKITDLKHILYIRTKRPESGMR